MRKFSVFPEGFASFSCEWRGLWLVGGRDVWCWGLGVVALAGVDAITLFARGNLDEAELAVPILVFGVVAQAVLVVEFVGNFVEGGFQFIDAANFQHAPAGGFGAFLGEGLSMAVLSVDVQDIAFVALGAIVNLQHIGDHIVLE